MAGGGILMTASKRVLTVAPMTIVAVRFCFWGQVDGRNGTPPQRVSEAVSAENPPEVQKEASDGRGREFVYPTKSLNGISIELAGYITNAGA